MWLSPDQSGPSEDQSPPDRGSRARLHLLLSYGGWSEGSVVDQLPRLLEPMGIRSIRAESGEEVAEVIRSLRVHIALIDLGIPFSRAVPGGSGGVRTLQLLRHLEQPPPTVVVRPPQPASRESTRELVEALRVGAFAVLDRPLRLETTLEVLRRILHRYYADAWPL